MDEIVGVGAGVVEGFGAGVFATLIPPVTRCDVSNSGKLMEPFIVPESAPEFRPISKTPSEAPPLVFSLLLSMLLPSIISLFSGLLESSPSLSSVSLPKMLVANDVLLDVDSVSAFILISPASESMEISPSCSPSNP